MFNETDIMAVEGTIGNMLVGLRFSWWVTENYGLDCSAMQFRAELGACFLNHKDGGNRNLCFSLNYTVLRPRRLYFLLIFIYCF
jgi:hypothetical protein